MMEPGLLETKVLLITSLKISEGARASITRSNRSLSSSAQPTLQYHIPQSPSLPLRSASVSLQMPHILQLKSPPRYAQLYKPCQSSTGDIGSSHWSCVAYRNQIYSVTNGSQWIPREGVHQSIDAEIAQLQPSSISEYAMRVSPTKGGFQWQS
ncbi:hypothetical protein BDV38DRAFT_244742 [Aspergillus pseudotamarii]|uniref:Uncharacterized protein n=1 Tax=Aspergillus pseudotamarii TaxID=132259 RepID=A0A5N6SV16_ASPPS|nr:uncharacterized protein BDV38DRAFT_244742 [Aspergillus pseudotamarii]KAE8138485.1 hypothetical protein BDV38DRAFT_244742 [Aspergillus pseudotamarii]